MAESIKLDWMSKKIQFVRFNRTFQNEISKQMIFEQQRKFSKNGFLIQNCFLMRRELWKFLRMHLLEKFKSQMLTNTLKNTVLQLKFPIMCSLQEQNFHSTNQTKSLYFLTSANGLIDSAFVINPSTPHQNKSYIIVRDAQDGSMQNAVGTIMMIMKILFV